MLQNAAALPPDFCSITQRAHLYPLYQVYAQSDSYAKYIGADEFYVRYSILLHNIWKGEDLNESVDAFIKAVSR